MSVKLCALEEIPDGGSKQFGDGSTDSLFAVRTGNSVYIYRNRCPHANMPLNWMPDRFLNRDKSHIICTAHGALFDIPSGECIAGPCPGQYLSSFEAQVKGGEVWVTGIKSIAELSLTQ